MSAFPSWDLKPLLYLLGVYSLRNDSRWPSRAAQLPSQSFNTHLILLWKAAKLHAIRETLFTWSRGDELDYRIPSFLLMQQNCQMLWKMVEMGTVFSFGNRKKSTFNFCLQKKKKTEGLVLNILCEDDAHSVFGWKSISVRKAFLISVLSASPGPDLQFMLTTLIPDTLRPNMVIHQTEGMCLCI